MIVRYSYSPHYEPCTYENEDVERIVDLLLTIRDRPTFVLLVQAIIDVNLHPGDGSSWLRDPFPESIMNVRQGTDQETVRSAVKILVALKASHAGDKIIPYLSAIPPKYILHGLEVAYDEDGLNDVYVHIEKTPPAEVSVWDSSQLQNGSTSVDAAIWNNSMQSGACYECKLDAGIKQNQINLLSTIWLQSDHKILVGIASFASRRSLETALARPNISCPGFVDVRARDQIFDLWALR